MKNTWKRLSREQRIEAIREGRSRGLSVRQIADELGCTKNAVTGMISRMKNIPSAQKRPDWSRMPPKAKADFLRNAYSSGVSTESIVRMVENASLKAITRCAERNGISRRVEKDKREESPNPQPKQISKTSPINIMDVLDWQCRGPLWDVPEDELQVPEDFNFCGKPVQSGSSFCSECHSRFWIKPSPRKADRRAFRARL